MRRFLHFVFLNVLLISAAQAQMTKLSSNTSLEVETPLSPTKTILVESGFKKLWVTDATTGGTVKLSDNIMYDEVGGVLNGKFIFAASNSPLGSELYITDGTPGGTKLLKDINPGTASSRPQDDFVLHNGFLYFTATTPDFGREIWRTDGSEDGTTMVADMTPGPAGSALDGAFNLFSNGSYLLFTMTTPGEGYELWRTNGTEASTSLVKDINPGPVSSEISTYTVYNNLVFFGAKTAANGTELWKTDGTTAGTQLVKDIRPGTESALNISIGLATTNLLAMYPLNGKMLFMANDGVHGMEIWSTDGTEDGTFLLKDINGEPAVSFISLFTGVKVGSRLIFSAYQQETGAELWETDGTTAGTKIFKEILPGIDGGIPMLLPYFSLTGTALEQKLYQDKWFFFLFSLPAEGGVELWKSDGTDAGTTKVKTLRSPDGDEETDDSDPGTVSYVYTNAGIYFSVDNGTIGSELWKSDGTDAGTTIVADINQGPEESEISFTFFPVNGYFIFTATDGDDAFKWDLYRLEGSLVPMPVKLESFTAGLQNGDGKLAWVTTLEADSRDFVIERSEDGKLFTAIGTVAAAGNSNSKRKYAFTDAGVANSGKPVVYYRLRMRDLDGSEEFSPVAMLNLKAVSGLQVQLLGNPVQSDIRLSISRSTAPLNISIRDATGKTVRSLQLKAESRAISIPASNLTPGVYFLQAETNGSSSVIKFIKQ
ncbi:T9SS type A sorting domain-containing protein [Flavisolibacter sp. BT320]|nr:T9SS type A sorting domain-containing protein [Flavisolibacter longurius]